jgi:hypothetical protein
VGGTKKSRRARGMKVEVARFVGAKTKRQEGQTRQTDGRTRVGGGRWTLDAAVDNGGLRRWRTGSPLSVAVYE